MAGFMLSSVYVEFKWKASKDEEVRSASCSGILLDNDCRIVLTSGILLSLLINRAKPDQSLSLEDAEKKAISRMLKESLKFYVIIDDEQKGVDAENSSFNSLNKYEANVLKFYVFDSLTNDLIRLLSEKFKFTNEDDDSILQGLSDEILAKMLSSFILLKIIPSNNNTNTTLIPSNKSTERNDASLLARIVNTNNVVRDVFKKLYPRTVVVDKGQNVWSDSNLFGNPHPVFMNCVSQGIVVNTSGHIFLTDARSTPGSEGGILFQKKRKRMWAGIILAPLLWKDKEAIGFTLSCKARPLVLDILQKVSLPEREHTTLPRLPYHRSARRGLHSVVLVKVGSTWGSGIVISQSQRLIITCSHVVKDASEVLVYLEFPEPKVFEGNVIFRTPKADTFDIALIQLSDDIHVTPATLCENNECYIGQEVLAVGYSLFSSHWNRGTVITSGVISKIISSNKKPVLLQTTCAVYSGASGGGIFDKYGKRLIAMIVCNSKDVVNNITYPNVNLALPMAVVFPYIKKYIVSQDVKTLSSLHTKDENIRELWHLGKVNKESYYSKL